MNFPLGCLLFIFYASQLSLIPFWADHLHHHTYPCFLENQVDKNELTIFKSYIYISN